MDKVRRYYHDRYCGMLEDSDPDENSWVRSPDHDAAVAALQARIAELEARNAASERDAGRYRWLRPQAHFYPRLAFHGGQGWEMQVEIQSHHSSFDEAIDAAIDAHAQGQAGEEKDG